MRSARFHGVRDIRIDDVAEPELRPGAVKIAVAWCGICGTDLHEYLEGPIFIPPSNSPHPLTGEAPPVTLGHEFSGTVEALGEGVTDLAVGDGVVVEPYVVCDTCPPCRAGNYHLCTNIGVVGLAGGGGGLSEKIVVDRRWVHPVGDIPLDQAALIEPLSVARHAVVRSGATRGATAVIGGAGPIGLLVAAVLADLGVTTIITEISAARKNRARTIADHVLDPTEVDVRARVLELTDGGADIGFECAGVDAVMDQVLDAVRPAGVVVNVAIWGKPAAIDMQKLVVKEIDLRGSFAYAHDHAEAIALVQRHGVDLSPFITSRIGLEQLVTHGLTALLDDAGTEVKILVHPGSP
ncbi:2,3-butanediol dehydrogenase [Actinomycetospora sp. NBRC 106378]|uniref:2,3-butanediol dehydrogenase n=1 Tax=Actinomycetospora sp. NBRC 106378 TaxID=3032208 RepID=UPI0024A20EBB|nr:2,3-butanediol dehydrogenase [Actinomycetospora sp. NBRC 106378]GLZ53520.1 2,3-butanediol dehydrogenase [Actinomycetospora sp. NBRC 106378]